MAANIEIQKLQALQAIADVLQNILHELQLTRKAQEKITSANSGN